ncbi:hypothetical protein DFP78_107111 [Photobacterium lutimaris]|nr:hypothetical protein DFP78_107111 [Photobacterium lutimaris]
MKHVKINMMAVTKTTHLYYNITFQLLHYRQFDKLKAEKDDH